ncbi:hypothetical protein CSA80_01690 [Candidatus Saccharibacteria bacterium]|nr:MAG: hypothetical protein CSA80_01690 [Candidatus Saccharibacteria bacterium]
MIDPKKYGISFSAKQCRNFGLDPQKTLRWLLKNGWRRFRLMSYWDEYETTQGKYDFSELDRHIHLIENAGGSVTLCLGVKQPRWPEYHWPAWALELPEQQKTQALLEFLQTTVQRYDKTAAVQSYQLENEALLRGFGRNVSINRARLRAEYQLVSKLTDKPISMSASNGWGIPLRQPRPRGGTGFSIYTTMFAKGKQRTTVQKPWLHRLRRFVIEKGMGRSVFVHELQLEPWGAKAIWEMTTEEQNQSMNPARIRANIAFAHQVGAYPIDLWGAEWWYWRYQSGDKTIWHSVASALED